MADMKIRWKADGKIRTLTIETGGAATDEGIIKFLDADNNKSVLIIPEHALLDAVAVSE